MANWLMRWLFGVRGDAAGKRPQDGAAAGRPAGAAPSLPPLPSGVAAGGYGHRHPLIGRNGRLAGFELRWPPALEARLAGRSDDAAAAQAAALVAAARLAANDGRRALVALDAGVFDRPGVLQQAAQGVMLAWRNAPPSGDAVKALRTRGTQVGAPDGPPEALAAADAPVAHPDFVLLRAAGGDVDTVLLSAQRWHEARPGLPVVATGLVGIDAVERVLKAGFALAGGRLDARGVVAAPRRLDAAAHRICELMNHLALDRDTSVIADAVRADVALSYRLLRYANSPAIGLARGVDTVEAAIALLGHVELQRWLAVLLLGAANARPTAAALQEHALARGRMFEALARGCGEPRPEALFTLGVMSQLDLLLQVPMATALEPLRLPDVARDALLSRRGPWAPYLDLAGALEGDDQSALDAAAAPLGGSDLALVEAEKAWAWAAELLSAGTRV